MYTVAVLMIRGVLGREGKGVVPLNDLEGRREVPGREEGVVPG